MAGTIHPPVLPAVPTPRLNGVRPRRPEQFALYGLIETLAGVVSMKSGLDGRNNVWGSGSGIGIRPGLNEVRPRWPEQ